MVIAWFKRMIRSRLNLRTFLPDVNKNLDPKGLQIKVDSFLPTHSKREGVVAEVACLVGSEDLKLDLTEAGGKGCLTLEKARLAGKS